MDGKGIGIIAHLVDIPAIGRRGASLSHGSTAPWLWRERPVRLAPPGGNPAGMEYPVWRMPGMGCRICGDGGGILSADTCSLHDGMVCMED